MTTLTGPGLCAAAALLVLAAAVPAGAAVEIVTSSPLPDGVEGEPYDVTLEATGGSGSYTWSVPSDGGLPLFWSVRHDGRVVAEGVDVVPGDRIVTAQVADTDAPEDTARRDFAVTVLPAPDGLRITTTALPTGNWSRPWEATLTAEGGTGSGYVWTLVEGRLPGGIEGLPGSGTPSITLSGTTMEAFAHDFTVQVADDGGGTAQRRLSLNVFPGSIGPDTSTDDSGCAAGSPAEGVLGLLLALATVLPLRRRSSRPAPGPGSST